MNERFFELKKDRQDRIINGAMRIFTENGYRHASTDEMVAAASISKGLLFHYFKSKKGTFRFLYEYGTRYYRIELREAERRAGCGFFEMYRLLTLADAAVLSRYPWLPLFLQRADREPAGAGAELPQGLAGAVAARRSALLEGAVRPPFLSGEDAGQILRMLEYTRDGLMRELLEALQDAGAAPAAGAAGYVAGLPGGESGDGSAAGAPLLHEAFASRMSGYLKTLRRLDL